MNDKNLMTPEERAMAEMFEEAARQVNVSPSFKTELEKKLMNAHQPKKGLGLFSFNKIASTAGWAIGWALLILMFIWVARTLAPQPQPAAANTPFPSVETATPESAVPVNSFDFTVKEGDTCAFIAFKYGTTVDEIIAINSLADNCILTIGQIIKIPLKSSSTNPTPQGDAYDWNGTKLYMNVTLPETPAEMKIYLAKDEVYATVEDANALAAQFGMSGEIYELPGDSGNATDYLIVDGNQQLRVRSDRYFIYFPDTAGKVSTGVYNDNSNAEALITEFMQSHGFNFQYRIERSQLYGAYIALPLSLDGFALHHEHLNFSGIRFYFNKENIEYVEASLLKYGEAATAGIISAQEAFDKLLDPVAGNGAGVIMGMASGSAPEDESWRRAFPLDQTLTYFGYMNSTGKSITGGAPLITLDGYTVTGNTEGVTENMQNVFVEATGQLHEVDGVKTFEVQTWKVHDGYDEGYVGTIQREGEQVVINTLEGNKLILPDMPADVPLPFENVYIMGVTQGDTFEWKSFDTRMANGGGGGGGGGLGFYKLNLSGTPVSFPTPTPTPSLGGGDYTVQEGDTLISIAQAHGITVEELMLANGLNDPTIFVGQGLVIPNPNGNPNQPSVGWEYKGQRGILTVSIYNKPDGSKRSEYYLAINNHDGLYPYVMLEGDELEQLQTYHNRPIEIWGKVVRYNEQYDLPVVEVERFNVPFPDLQFQIVKGRQELMNIDGQSVTAFTIENGASYVQLMPGGDPDSSIIGIQGDLIQQEILIIPDETFGGRPAMRIYAGSIIEEGSPELTITANQPYTYDDSANIPPVDYVQPTATIEKVELVYYMPDPRYITTELVIDQRYLQPAWLFRGQYSDGSEFFILIQALKDEFLLPELAPYTQPG